MKNKIIIHKDGEWVHPTRNNYFLTCCDCGLTHKITFRIIKNGKDLIYRAFRDNRKTAQRRRRWGIKYEKQQLDNKGGR